MMLSKLSFRTFYSLSKWCLSKVYKRNRKNGAQLVRRVDFYFKNKLKKIILMNMLLQLERGDTVVDNKSMIHTRKQ